MLDMTTRKRKPQPVGLREIATRLNVALSTVSRALAGDPGVGEVKAASIRAMADQMGYQPRPIRRKRTRSIGLIISTSGLSRPDENERYAQNVVWWMERLAAQLKMHVHVHFVLRDDAQWPPLLHENRVDGVILAGFPSLLLCRAIREHGIPAVSISDQVERCGCSAIMVRPEKAIEDVVDRLVKLGHRKITFASTQREYPVIAVTEDAFRAALEKHNIPFEPARMLTGMQANIRGGREAVERLCAMNALPTAMIFTNDWMALGGVNELHRRGYQIPRDVSIVGHDNLSVGTEIVPPLTSIDRVIEQIIVQALEMLRRQIETGQTEPEQRYVPATIQWRASCDVAPGKS